MLCSHPLHATPPPQLLQRCRLVERILTSWEENDRVQ